MSTSRIAAMLGLCSALLPALLEPRPALLRWAWEIAPWILCAAVGWSLVLLWMLRGVATVFLRTPGRRLHEVHGEDADA